MSYQKASSTSWKLAKQFVLLICIAINHYCQVLINFVNQNITESLTPSGLGGMSGGRGQYSYGPECGSARCDKFGNKPKIRSLKTTKVGSKLLVSIEGEVVETRLTHLAKIQLYVNTILRKKI